MKSDVDVVQVAKHAGHCVAADADSPAAEGTVCRRQLPRTRCSAPVSAASLDLIGICAQSKSLARASLMRLAQVGVAV